MKNGSGSSGKSLQRLKHNDMISSETEPLALISYSYIDIDIHINLRELPATHVILGKLRSMKFQKIRNGLEESLVF